MNKFQPSDGDGSDVRLYCRNIWKVYGKNADRYFSQSPDDPAALVKRIRADGAIPAAANVSFDVRVGEIFVIMGLSGSGKSTVVRCLSRLVEPTHGRITLSGDDLLAKSPKEMIQIRRHKIGMVFQNFGLMPHLTVYDNVAFPLSLQGEKKADIRAQVDKVIELVGLRGRENSYPHQLSGGQQQRVGIARSLAVDPDLWLLDEPFSALDPLIRRQMQDEFLRIQNDLRKSIVFITHDFLEALRVADRMMIMRGGQVVQTGTPAELITNPADDYVAEFTNDVPLARVLRAAQVTDAKAAAAAAHHRVPADTSVETLLPMLAEHPGGLGVERDGTTIGMVTAQSVIAALAHHAGKSETGGGHMTGDGDRRRVHWAWFALIGLTLAILGVRDTAQALMVFPEALMLPLTDWFNAGMDVVVAQTGPFFRGVSQVMAVPMGWIRGLLQWMPWALTLSLLTLASYAVSGWKLALFTALAVFYMVVIGYWAESMNSLALVVMSVPMAVFIGFFVGTAAYYSARADRVIAPTMDVLQTIPVFAYLLPILLLFGFGPVVGLIASILYAVPPMVRNTTLGLRRVDPEVIEAGMMAGATPLQMFWRVRVPSALRQILLGVNQTMMAAFSMVIIASIIGGTSDIGWEVLSTMRKAEFGESILAGIVIALMAMVMDRMTARAANASREDDASENLWSRYRYWIIAGQMTVVILVVSRVLPVLQTYPETWEVYPAQMLNDWLTYVLVEYSDTIKSIKTLALFYIMLPVKMGLEQTVSPFSWGFALTPTLKSGYAVLALAGALWFGLRGRMGAAVLVAGLAILLYFGLTRLPWPSIMGVLMLLAWQVGGTRLALGSGAGMAFLLLAGVWPEAMLSVYLCGIAVLLSFMLGTLLGILASENDTVSAILRPINDTLQTMPPFVLLIPFVMIFKLGDFTALLAIISYAIVPAIRYAEHGLRNIAPEVIEAAHASGATRLQMLWRVRLPLAAPQLMLGLNQTIMYGIAMLVIAALVGTNGLGQRVYIGLSNGDFGTGMIAGIGMAIIAMIADRMTQAYSRKVQPAAR